MLKALGYYYGDITGNIGTKTETAIRSFQSKYGLTVDGIPGTQTMAKLSELYSGTSTLSGSSLQLGATGSAVSALQENLSALGYYNGDVTGHYGTLTKAAVLAFQKAKGLTADGIAGTRTLSAIDYAMGIAGGSSSGTADSSGSSFGLGDTSATILWMQELLKELGYYGGKCSGTCPSFDEMEYHPHQFVTMVRKGQIEKLMASKSIYKCLSCFACIERCPRNVEPAKLIEAVRLAVVRQQGMDHLKPEAIAQMDDEQLPQQAITSAFRKYKR